MENVTSPTQVLFLLALFVAFLVVAGWWLFKGIPKDAPVHDESTGELMRQAAYNILHWRAIPMSSGRGDEPVRGQNRTGSESGFTGSSDLVRAHQNQLEPESEAVHEPSPEPTSLHRMSRVEEIAMLAVQRNDDGSYRHSANKICELMGGTAAEVKGQIAAIRGPAKPPQAPPAGRVTRPADGWEAKAS